MRNKKGYVFLFVMLLLFPLSVRALSGSVSINCGSSSVKPGDTVTCTISANTDEVVTAFEANLSIAGNASPISFVSAYDKWEKCSLTDDKVSVGCATGYVDISGSFDVGTLNLKVADDASGNIVIGLSNLSLPDTNFHGVDTSGVSINAATLTVETETASGGNEGTTTDNGNTTTTDNSDKNKSRGSAIFSSAKLEENSKLYLVELNIEGYELDFNKDDLDYELTIGDEDSLNITPVLNDDSIGSYKIVGNFGLSDESKIYIVLTTNDESEKVVYSIAISKRSDNETIDASTTDNNNVVKIIFGVLIGLLLIINVVRILMNKKKNKDQP